MNLAMLWRKLTAKKRPMRPEKLAFNGAAAGIPQVNNLTMSFNTKTRDCYGVTFNASGSSQEKAARLIQLFERWGVKVDVTNDILKNPDAPKGTLNNVPYIRLIETDPAFLDRVASLGETVPAPDNAPA